MSYDYGADAQEQTGDNAMAELRHLALQQKEAEAEVARLEEALVVAKESLRYISEVRLPELMDELGIPTFSTADGLKITIKETLRASMGRSDDEKDEALDWLEKNGHGALIKRTVEVPFPRGGDEEAIALREQLKQSGKRAVFARRVESATLRAFLKECLEGGVDIPLDLFRVVRDRRAKVDI